MRITHVMRAGERESHSIEQQLAFHGDTHGSCNARLSYMRHNRRNFNHALLQLTIGLRNSFDCRCHIAHHAIARLTQSQCVSRIGKTLGQAWDSLRNIGIAISRTIIQFEIFHKLTPSECGLRGSATEQCDEPCAAIVIFDARNTREQIIFGTIFVSISSNIFCWIPRILRTEYHARHGHARIVDMPKIAPIGDEHAFRTAVAAVSCDACNVVPRVVDAREQRIPPPYGRAYDLFGSGFRHKLDFLVGRFRFVLPVQQGDVVWQGFENFRHLDGDVSPKHGLMALLGKVFAEFAHVCCVQRCDAYALSFLLRLAFAEVKGFVGADIESFRAEKLQVRVDQLRGECEGSIVGDVERVVPHAFDEAERPVCVFGEFAKFAQFLRAHRHVLVAECGD